MSEGIPRRNRTDRQTHAEAMIRLAVEAVEHAGADVRLTDAVVLLQEARESVADFVDGADPIVRRRAVAGEQADVLRLENTVNEYADAIMEAHALLDEAGIPQADRARCDFGRECKTKLGHRVRELVRERDTLRAAVQALTEGDEASLRAILAMTVHVLDESYPFREEAMILLRHVGEQGNRMARLRATGSVDAQDVAVALPKVALAEFVKEFGTQWLAKDGTKAVFALLQQAVQRG